VALNETEVKQTRQEKRSICARRLTVSHFQVDALEHDALQVLSLLQSTRNTFALVNRIPPEILTLIPDYWTDGERERSLVRLTHVCRGWREIFISCPSLWARLDCKRAHKTRVYIERSKSSPLEICLGQVDDEFCQEEAFLLAVPHIGRLKALSVSGSLTPILPVLVEHFSRAFPLLETLKIGLDPTTTELPNTLFNGDLSSLRELSLTGGLIPQSWRGLSNLTTFNLHHVPGVDTLLTQLLDFFESTPHLRHIQLHHLIPDTDDAPIERVTSLPCLKKLSIIAQPVHSILLNHLTVPAGASLRLEFSFDGAESPVPFYLPKSLDSLCNLSYITAVALCFGSERRFMRLHGPSGELYVLGNWISGRDQPYAGTNRFLRSLSQFDISRTRRLAITLCRSQPPDTAPVVTWAIYRILRSMKNLHTFTLVRCKNLPFILALNPKTSPSGIILCPELEEIILHIGHSGRLNVDELLSMLKERASRGAKLSTITIVGTDVLTPKEVKRLKKHVSCVKYKFDGVPPEWDTLPS